MRHQRNFRLNLALTIGICTLTVAPVWAEPSGSKLFVQVESAKLREVPQQWAKPVASLVFGDQITVKSTDRGWVSGATKENLEGFVHESAVTTSKIILKPVGASLSELTVDDTDVYLAGKGFNVGTEEALAKRDAKLNYAAVDKMLASAKASTTELDTFVKVGGLAR